MSDRNEEIKEQERSAEDIKKEKRKKEADELWRSVQAGDNRTLNIRVANILNRYPETRDSDVTLQIRYWQVYNNINSKFVNVEELYKLERLTSISRARAKIQNEYQLFLASEKVRGHRRTKEDEEKETQLLDQPLINNINIYSDETGKNEKYVIVAGIWFLDEMTTAKIQRDYMEWTSEKQAQGMKLPKEFHFKDLNNKHETALQLYKDFFNLVIQNGEMVSFKAVGVNKSKINRLSISDLINRLYYQFVRLGIAHEINSGRIKLPRKINLTKDEDGDSEFVIETLKQTLVDNFKLHYDEKLIMDQLVPMESHKSIFLQFADLFAASLNRRFNHLEDSDNNKDKLSRYILETMGINEIQYTANQVEEDIGSTDQSDQSILYLFD